MDLTYSLGERMQTPLLGYDFLPPGRSLAPQRDWYVLGEAGHVSFGFPERLCRRRRAAFAWAVQFPGVLP